MWTLKNTLPFIITQYTKEYLGVSLTNVWDLNAENYKTLMKIKT